MNFQRALLILDKTNIQCDYWDLLEGKEVNYGGEFLSSYEWSLPFESEINDLIEKNL